MTVREWITTARHRLSQSGVEAADLEAQLLAAHVLLVPRTWLMAHPEEPFPELAGESVLSRRLGHEPLAYILGYREFYGRRFFVGPGVLIPRQETEVLVEAALRYPGGSVLDLGTGSGCIAVTLKLERPGLSVVASDISGRALEIAEKNAEELGASVRFVESDGFTGFVGERFDLVVTNPPYVGFAEPLAPELTLFEPRGALYSGETGLEFYERLAAEAGEYLNPGGAVLMEVGYMQAEEVVRLFLAKGWRHLETVRDLSGVARVVVCSKAFGPDDTK